MTVVRLRTALVAACAAWAMLIVAAPLLASRAHASPAASALILGVYGIASLVCHQLPERSSQLWGAQMPVCARCAGIYAGAVLGAAFALCAPASLRHGRPEVAQGFSSAWSPRIVLALAVTPTVLTLIYEWASGDMPSHAIRAAAGAAIGLVTAWLVVAAVDNQVN